VDPLKLGITGDTAIRQVVTPGRATEAVVELPHHYSRAPSAYAAIEAAERLAEEAIADMESYGGTPPPSLTDHRYSGNFVVRTSPQLHARLVVEANEQNVSLNQRAVQKLANRPLSIDDLF
jgi:predicted HicB family RNase H-like nuclease